MTTPNTDKSQVNQDKLNGGTPPATSSRSSSTIFDDLDRLRIADPALLGGDIEHLVHIGVRKPKKDGYFRVCPDPAMTMTALVWVDPDEGDAYFVGPGARELLAESGRIVTLMLCQSRQRATFLWPVNSDTRSGSGRSWAESARAAALIGQHKWVKIKGDRPSGCYQVFEAANQAGEPEWPDVTLNKLLTLGFKDRVIASSDHPVVRRLQGY
jgi:hypothetical protein